MGAEDFHAFLRTELVRWAASLKASGVKGD
jgi:hypothetical protein